MSGKTQRGQVAHHDGQATDKKEAGRQSPAPPTTIVGLHSASCHLLQAYRPST